MGTDIHAKIEYRHRDPLSDSDSFPEETNPWFIFAHPFLGRRYDYFAAMAGVRIEPGAITPLFAPRGLPVGEFDDRDGRYSDFRAPGFHSHSFLTTSEFRSALTHSGITLSDLLFEWRATLAAMGTLEEEVDARLVFCFTD
jgi:hypothetical protein